MDQSYNLDQNNSVPAQAGTRDIPLVVDLDGTLIKTDTLLEGFYAMIKKEPLAVLQLPLWLLKGRAYMKNRIAERAHIDEKSLPYNPDLMDFLRREFNQGRRLVLATASVRQYAEKVARHLGIFSEVIASDEQYNISGRIKLAVLLEKYGEKGFDYAGNDRPDLHIFQHARHAILVNPGPGLLAAAQKTAFIKQVFRDRRLGLHVYLNTTRLYQWVKNFLLFVPLITSHTWGNVRGLRDLTVGFFCFGLCASGGYIFNDLLDLKADRNHPRKKFRAFASGDLSIWTGSALMLIFLFGGLGLAAAVNLKFFVLLAIYSFISLAYTFHFKTYVLIDVLILAGLYTLRIIAGAVLVNVPLSFWLFAFSVFIFFSLALVKRCSELMTLINAQKEYAGERDYSVADIGYLREMGIASGYMAVMVVALYINSPDVAALYSRPKVLWLLCPVLFYWVSRLWLKTGRGEMADDPIVFSIKDRGCWYVVVAIIIIIMLAI